MRCKNCGWENSSSNMRCEKCNAPLSGSMVEDASTVRDGHSGTEGDLRSTVSEKQFFMSIQDRRPADQSAPVERHGVSSGTSAGKRMETCPECGYMLGSHSRHCPNCGADLQADPASLPGQEPANRPESEPRAGFPRQTPGSRPSGNAEEKCRQCGQPIPKEARFCPVCGTPKRAGTVNPWAVPQGENRSCTLKPVAWENENIDFSPLSFSGNNIILTRANTDPNNQTITSQQQAELSCENGQWYILDKSTQQTTYVHAGKKIKLESGDTIILGNRRFEFNGGSGSAS